MGTSTGAARIGAFCSPYIVYLVSLVRAFVTVCFIRNKGIEKIHMHVYTCIGMLEHMLLASVCLEIH